MTSAEELLNQVTETGSGETTGTISYLNVDMESRRIIIPPNITNIGVESDDEVKRLWFRMNRYYHGIDLSTFTFRINYTNAEGDGDVYGVDDLNIGDNELTFSWLIGRYAVSKAGTVSFVICLIDIVDMGVVNREFNTTIATLPVLKGLETVGMITEDQMDAIFQASKNGAREGADEALREFEKAIDATIELCDAYIDDAEYERVLDTTIAICDLYIGGVNEL